MRRCFIFAAGTYYGLRQAPEKGDLVIAADAGYLACCQAGLTPDLLLGDFDSMEAPANFPNLRRAPVEKDDTDTISCVNKAFELGFKKIILLLTRACAKHLQKLMYCSIIFTKICGGLANYETH